MMPLQLHATDPAGALVATQAIAQGFIALAALVLLYYLYTYGKFVLAVKKARRNLWYFAVGNGAAVIYAAAGIAALWTGADWPEVFSEGATLFFIMFYALGFRSVYLSAPRIAKDGRDGPGDGALRRYLPPWLDYVIIAGYIAAWWGSFLFAQEFTGLIVGVGWLLASGWAFVWAIVLVRRHEGTSLAALTRHLFPAVVAFTVTILADLVGTYVAPANNIVTGMWIVGTVLVGAFFVTTAIALRQEGGEVERLYDWSTYRGRGSLSDDEDTGEE